MVPSFGEKLLTIRVRGGDGVERADFRQVSNEMLEFRLESGRSVRGSRTDARVRQIRNRIGLKVKCYMNYAPMRTIMELKKKKEKRKQRNRMRW